MTLITLDLTLREIQIILDEAVKRNVKFEDAFYFILRDYKELKKD